MNTNLIHNALNLLMALIAAVQAFLLATGCTVVVETGALECSQSWVPPQWAALALAVLAAAKIVINIFRDGLAGLTKPQPPVR